MSYASEPYAQFVDDLVTALTGGAVREDFFFIPENEPFRLTPPGPIVPGTVRVFGQSNAAYTSFRLDRDFTLTADNTIKWKARDDGSPAADAVWPDLGTRFYSNYYHQGPSGLAPLLTDRNPGSVVRLLSESFAREYAVLSRQLESVYRAGFLDTAGGRDLEQLVALLGLTRRTRIFGVGTAVFERPTPAPADIFIPAGTRLSTGEPPAVVFETTEDRTLHRGSLSVEASVRATTAGSIGVVSAQAIAVIHRPVFGIETVSNPQPTQLSGADEADDALRARARRSFEGAGKATTGALFAALTTLPGIREKDVRIDEDPISRPGVITLNVAAELDPGQSLMAIDLVEQTRPAGVRVMHDLDVPLALGPLTPGPNPDDDTRDDASAEATSTSSRLFYPVAIKAIVLPASGSLNAQERAALKRSAEDALRVAVAEVGIGEVVVYNRLVAAVMALDGVLDITVDLYPNVKAALPPSHRNLIPPSTLRPSVDEKNGVTLQVEIGGQLIALDVTVTIKLQKAGLIGNPQVNLEDARVQVAGQLRAIAGSITTLSVPTLLGKITPNDNFTVTSLSFKIEYIDAGVRISKVFTGADATSITLTPVERLWVRTVKLDGASG